MDVKRPEEPSINFICIKHFNKIPLLIEFMAQSFYKFAFSRRGKIQKPQNTRILGNANVTAQANA